MKKYLIVISCNFIILLLGIFLSFSNEKIDIRVLEQNCYTRILNDYHFENDDKEDIMKNYSFCFDEVFIDDTFFENISALQPTIDPIETVVHMDSKDNFLSIETIFTYDTNNTIDTFSVTSYKYMGDHIPYDIISILLILFLNTMVYLLDSKYQKKYSMNTLFNTTDSALVIAFIITNQFSYWIPIYYYLSGIYLLTHIFHIYIIYFTKSVAYRLKIEESEADMLHDSLNRLHVDLRISKRVNFGGNYYMVRIEKDQIIGFEKLMDEIIPENRKLYFYINLALVSLINIVAISYLVRYFLQ